MRRIWNCWIQQHNTDTSTYIYSLNQQLIQKFWKWKKRKPFKVFIPNWPLGALILFPSCSTCCIEEPTSSSTFFVYREGVYVSHSMFSLFCLCKQLWVRIKFGNLPCCTLVGKKLKEKKKLFEDPFLPMSHFGHVKGFVRVIMV